jgi:prepilin-type N-terminal cleavage/methylation domain-containing protein
MLYISIKDSARSFAFKERGGFTLAEILIALAIIALLASILFPAFQRVRENSRRISCQSNLKQLGTPTNNNGRNAARTRAPFNAAGEKPRATYSVT